MYHINKDNTITKIEASTFSELGFKERKHIQEWIAQNPSCLGEELLIIQKEFADFDGTSERLDLLALDKEGNIVVIENKRDDSGHDVTWQALKYASYCYTLENAEIVKIYADYLQKCDSKEDARTSIEAFLDCETLDSFQLNEKQRMIFVSRSFRKEVTSTVLWLRDRGLDIRCVKITPFKFEGDIFLDVDTIIPLPETSEYTVKIAQKKMQEEKIAAVKSDLDAIRHEYWIELLKKYNTIEDSFKNINPSGDSWIGCGSGVSGVSFNFIARNDMARVELYIGTQNADYNNAIFDALFAQKGAIENELGHPIEWQRLNSKKACRIALIEPNCDVRNRVEWDRIMNIHCKYMPLLEKALRDRLKKAANQIKK